jgi:hypothetical protein
VQNLRRRQSRPKLEALLTSMSDLSLELWSVLYTLEQFIVGLLGQKDRPEKGGEDCPSIVS